MPIVPMTERDIVRTLADRGYMIDPGALELLKGHADLLDRLLEVIDPSAFMVSVDDVYRLMSLPEPAVTPVAAVTGKGPDIRGQATMTGDENASGSTVAASESDAIVPIKVARDAGSAYYGDASALRQDMGSGEAISDIVLSKIRSAGGPEAARPDRNPGKTRPENISSPEISGKARDVRVINDITNNSTCIGNYDEFVGFFRNRYARLGEIIRGRLSARPIESIRKNGSRRSTGEKSEISIIGMVSDIRNTTNGHRIAELQDQTGSINVLFQKDGDLKDAALLLDEVIGVTGMPTSDGGLFISSALSYPDVPYTNTPRRSEERSIAALLSDIHIGSDTFLEDGWLRFIDWVNGDVSEGDSDLVNRLRYIIIAGDLVDGIGIYPGQEKELTITDVYDQYRKAAEYMSMLPRHIRIIISPGNHDAVRQAEPQPALSQDVQDMFKGDNITFVGNPATVEIEGVRVMIYHGRSLDDLVSNLPGASYSHPDIAMAELLKRRHLSPVYGGRVMIAPEAKDHFIIDPLPDIIHTGHVHTVGVSRYRGILLANSGTWQGQTEFQKRMNIQPDPCRIPFVDLSSGEVKIIKFID
jgi:DNA polymerase II small subunit